MAVAFGSVSSLAATTATVNKPASTAAGDLLVIYFQSDTGSDSPTLSGWNKVQGSYVDGFSRVIGIFWRVADGSEGSTFTVGGTWTTGNYTELTCFRYTGAHRTTPIIVPTYGSGNVAASITPFVTNCLDVVYLSFDFASANSSAPAGWSRDFNGAGSYNLYACSRTQTTAAATGTQTFTNAVANDADSGFFRFAIAPAGSMVGTPTFQTPIGPASGSSSTTGFTTASFTPGANDVVLVLIAITANGGVASGTTTWSVSNTGFGTLATAWTQLARYQTVLTSTTSYGIIHEVWACRVGASPSSGTVTATRSAGTLDQFTRIHVCSVPDAQVPGSPNHGSDKSATTAPNAGSKAVSLASAPAASSMQFGVATLGGMVTAAITAPTGWTEANDTADSWGDEICFAYDPPNTSQSNTWAWTNAVNDGFYATNIEIPVASAGGTGYTSSLSGSITAAGVIKKDVTQKKVGSSTAVGLPKKAVSIARAGSTTGAGAIFKQWGKALAGSTTGSGTIRKALSFTRAGSSTASGLVVKAVAKVLSGSSTGTGSYSGLKIPGGGGGTAYTMTLTGQITAAGAAIKAAVMARAGTSTPSGTVRKAVSLTKSGSVTPAGTRLSFGYGKVFTGSVTAAGTASKAVTKKVTGSITGVGTILKQRQKTLAGSITPTSTLRKAIGRVFSGVVGLYGTLTSPDFPTTSTATREPIRTYYPGTDAPARYALFDLDRRARTTQDTLQASIDALTAQMAALPQGIVAIGSQTFAEGATTPSGTNITNNLVYTMQTGRRYRIVIRLRATHYAGATPLTGDWLALLRDGSAVTDTWWLIPPTASGYSYITSEWFLVGDNTSHTWAVKAQLSGSVNFFTHSDGYFFYIEDMGAL